MTDSQLLSSPLSDELFIRIIEGSSRIAQDLTAQKKNDKGCDFPLAATLSEHIAGCGGHWSCDSTEPI
jgi:hypothetical protein